MEIRLSKIYTGNIYKVTVSEFGPRLVVDKTTTFGYINKTKISPHIIKRMPV